MNEQTRRRWLAASAAAVQTVHSSEAAGEHTERAPRLEVVQVRRISHNSEHNAFTDLCRYRDRSFLRFRNCPDGHGVHPTESIIVLNSEDEGTR